MLSQIPKEEKVVSDTRERIDKEFDNALVRFEQFAEALHELANASAKMDYSFADLASVLQDAFEKEERARLRELARRKQRNK